MKTLFEYFDRVEIVHLPEREDRFVALRDELSSAGYDIRNASIPPAPKPSDSFGFASRGVYGNYLSHLDIIKRAGISGAKSVLVLEDDAIFSHRFRHRQSAICDQLANLKWDILYLGYSLESGNSVRVTPDLAQFAGDLIWAHCYAINQSIVDRLTKYLEYAHDAPAGDPIGGKPYIDAALNLFRRHNPDVICLIAAPCLSVQKGSKSNLGRKVRLDNMFPRALSLARSLRDECWRRGLIKIGAK